MAIAPGGAMQRAQDKFWTNLADAGEVFLQHALLGRHLRAGFQMLHRTAAATAEVAAARLGALRAGFEDGRGVGRVVFGVFAVDRDFRAFAGQRAIDEGDLAVDAGDAVALVVEGEDVDDRIHAQAARNSCQCGAAWLATVLRASSISAAYAGSV